MVSKACSTLGKEQGTKVTCWAYSLGTCLAWQHQQKNLQEDPCHCRSENRWTIAYMNTGRLMTLFSEHSVLTYELQPCAPSLSLGASSSAQLLLQQHHYDHSWQVKMTRKWMDKSTGLYKTTVPSSNPPRPQQVRAETQQCKKQFE